MSKLPRIEIPNEIKYFLEFLCVVQSYSKQYNTILQYFHRFVDRQNPDGSYTYGYESGDGTYKIETRYFNSPSFLSPFLIER